jgi:hypothetical protein
VRGDIFSYLSQGAQPILRAADGGSRRAQETSQKQPRKRTEIMNKTTKNSGIKVKANVKSGGFDNRNHSRVGIRVRAGVKAGEILLANHSGRLLLAR